MIATTILVILFIVAIFITLIHKKFSDDLDDFWELIWFVLLLYSALIFIPSIYSGYVKQFNIIEMKKIEMKLEENNLDWDALEEAQKYNEKVNFGNNLWCRFDIEDRDNYLIDIEKYLEK